MMLAPLERADIPAYYGAKPNLLSLPTIDQNPLLDVKIPSAIIDPDSPSFSTNAVDPSPEPSAVLGPDSQDLAPPSLNPPAASKPVHRNPLRDIELPNAIVAPDFQGLHPPSFSPTMHSARSFNSIACPPQLLPQDWNSFTSELERAAANYGMTRTSFEIAIGIAAGVGYPTTEGNYVWGKWHNLPVQHEGKVDIGGMGKGEWEDVGRVVEKFNQEWADRGVRVALEIRDKGRRKSSGSLSE